MRVCALAAALGCPVFSAATAQSVPGGTVRPTNLVVDGGFENGDYGGAPTANYTPLGWDPTVVPARLRRAPHLA